MNPEPIGLNMNNLSSKQLSLYICILMSAAHAEAGSASRPDRLSPCPNSPNCVSTQSTDKARFIEPLHYVGSLADARQNLISILKNIKRVRLVKVETDYIHAEFRSQIFHFIDDVEFYFPPDKTIIHVKSASRKGYYDFGANRRRVEWLRATFEKLVK
jgi:uncharacterized protein (DUF1499 family)